MKKCAELLAGHFEQEGLHYGMEVQESGEIIFMGVMGGFEGAFSTFNFYVVVEDDVIKGMAILPFSITGDFRAAVSELITHINYKLKYGRFEMDYEDGEVRYRVCLPAFGINGHIEEYVRLLLHLPLEMVGDWAQAFSDVALKGRSPKKIAAASFKRLKV